MPARITIKQTDLLKVLDDLKLLQQYSSESVLVRLELDVKKSKLLIDSKSYAYNYRNEVSVTVLSEGYICTTVLLPPNADLWSGVSTITLEDKDNTVRLYTDFVTLVLDNAYEVLERYKLPVCDFEEVSEELQDCRTLLNASKLGKLLKKQQNIDILSGRGMLRYNNAWVQLSMHMILGDTLDFAISPDELRRVVSFMPTHIGFIYHTKLVLKRESAYLVLPITTASSTQVISTLSKTKSKPSTLTKVTLGDYAKRLSSYCKLTDALCNITLYNSGISTSLPGKSISVQASCGTKDTVVEALRIPIDIWVTALSLFKDSEVEIWTEGKIIWIKKYNLITAIHAFY